jgi:hypothetical protein
VQLHLAEAKPMIGVQLTRPIEPMAQQIQNHQTTIAFQDAMRRGHGLFGVHRVMQGLAQNSQIHAVLRDRRIFNIAQPVFEIFEIMFSRKFRSELNHLGRIINGDDFPRVPGQQLGERSLARSQIGHG